MVGQRFLEKLVGRMNGASPEVTVFCDEPRQPTIRVQLTSFFSGRSAADLSWFLPDFSSNTESRSGSATKAVAIDRARQARSFRARAMNCRTTSWCSQPAPIPLCERPGAEWPDCFVYRAIEDLEAIRAAAARARVGTVVGGGLLGLEAAKAAA